ncbi:hypothetical protein TSAR_001004 [Trichomalopsis sarcophagae]|uniref:Uncharacterized protein n=1 Tax=Trichomalopsis sarcophagae TaxID=543379 RepID=A0A232FHG9_9HYME|nr:hypothetical protein TSAR_001004 [Trichomalopsis sarcophagae]
MVCVEMIIEIRRRTMRDNRALPLALN